MVIVLDFSKNGHHQLWSDFAVSWLAKNQIDHRQVFIPEDFLAECSRAGKIGGAVVFWQRLSAILRPASDDLCVFMYWDYPAPFWLPFQQRAILFPAKIMGIWMNSWSTRHGFLKDKSLSICLLDEHVYSRIAGKTKASINWIPDFTSTEMLSGALPHPLLTELRNFKADKELLLLVGAINGSKNTALLQKLIDTGDLQDWKIAIVGESFLPPESLEKILSHASIVRQWSGRVTDDTLYNAIVKEATLLWGAYLNWQGSSNLVTKAGMLSIPVVVSRGFLMQERVEKYALGFVVDQDNPAELNSLLHNWDAVFAEYVQSNVAQRKLFKQTFSTENAAEVFVQVVAESHERESHRAVSIGAHALLTLRRSAQACINLVKYLVHK